MTGPIEALKTGIDARWLELGYADTPIVYGYKEAQRTRDIDAVALGNGRIVYHLGGFPGPDASAGDMRLAHAHATIAGRTVGTAGTLFTVHLHGFDATFADDSTPEAQLAHDNICWRLREMFYAVLFHVVPQNRWFMTHGPQTIVRNPTERRFGEVLRCEFNIDFSIRSAPEYPFVHPIPKPTGIVTTPNGNNVTLVEVL
jgi:hypothetical protein